MSKAEIEKLVTEGFVLDREIKERSKRLDEIKEVLATRANGNDLKMEGAGCLAAIYFNPSLDRTLKGEKEARAKEIAGSFFNKLFCRAPIAKFKDVATALLGEKAGELVELLSGEKSARVTFKEV
jgi:hypothetical protein